MQIKSLFVLASLAVSCLAGTSFAQVQDDILNDMASAVMGFGTAVNRVSPLFGTRSQVKALHYSASALNDVIAKTTDDIDAIASQFSDDDARQLFDALQSLQPSFFKSLIGIATRKLAIGLIPDVSALIKEDIKTMKQRCVDFMDAFISHAPPSVLDEAQAMKASVITLFSSLLLLETI
ncbi:hypothetical protein C0993_009843 [Termitomyces sp. T159_Od127]|nr:hypothetical protein C0993_009843 [Termitomyces sp. T159_Od127]